MKYSNINLVGHNFGKLKAVSFVDTILGRSVYKCICECGNIVEKQARYLVSGETKSCGCLKIDTAKANSKKCVTHGLTKHPLYKVWSSMKDRCLNEKCHAYKDYGARGITVSNEWISFEKFYNDTIPLYKKGLELDRIENNGGYSVNNFRWSTPTVNKRNRRNSIFLTVNGITKHISEWSEETGIPRHSIFHRIAYCNKTGEQALYGRIKKIA